MAERRMFTKKITESDAFLDMPLSAQALYFHINMAADDEGFVNNPKKIQRMIGASDDDLKLLIMKNFLITYDTGVIVIKHWKMHNYISKDRFHPTVYQDERQMLKVKENGAYTFDDNVQNSECIQDVSKMYTECIQDVPRMYTEDSIGKDSIGKDSIGKDSIGKDIKVTTASKKDKTNKPIRHKYGEYAHVLLTDSDYNKLCEDYGDIETGKAIRYLDEYKERKGYKSKNDYLTIKKWVFDAVRKEKCKSDDWSDA